MRFLTVHRLADAFLKRKENIMKKIISLLVCLLILSSALSGFSAGVNYTVSPANITITIPDSMEVFTRNTSPADERFSAMGFGYDTMMESFNSQSIYLQAMSTDAGNQKELVLICISTDEKEYSDVTSLYNAAVAEGNALEKQGKTVITEDIFEHDGTDYIVLEYSDVFSKREYVTIHSGMKIRIRLTDYDGDISSSEEDFLENIIKSVKIPKTEKKEPDVQKGESSPEETGEETSVNETEEENSAKETEEETTSSEPTDESSGEKKFAGLSEDAKNNIKRFLILLISALLLITLPALIMRLFLFRRGFSRSGAKTFAIIYSILLAILGMYLFDKKLMGDIPVYFVLLPLLWSFIIYKIVKH